MHPISCDGTAQQPVPRSAGAQGQESRPRRREFDLRVRGSLYTLNKLGIEPEKFFARSQITGSHQNVIFALVSGTVDVAADSWNSESYSNLTRMLNKGLLKKPDGSPMTVGDFRIILKSPMILSGPFTYLEALPAEVKADIRKAFFAAPTKVKDVFDRLSDGNNLPWEPIETSAYDETIRLIQFVDGLRKRS